MKKTTRQAKSPPAPRRITENDQPKFPCWLWDTSQHAWRHRQEFMWAKLTMPYYTHWLPDQPEAPTCVPGAEVAPTPLPQEWAERAAKEVSQLCFIGQSAPDFAKDVLAIILRHAPSADASAARTEASLWQRKYQGAAVELARVTRERDEALAAVTRWRELNRVQQAASLKNALELKKVQSVSDERFAQLKDMTDQFFAVSQKCAAYEAALPGVVEALEAATAHAKKWENKRIQELGMSHEAYAEIDDVKMPAHVKLERTALATLRALQSSAPATKEGGPV